MDQRDPPLVDAARTDVARGAITDGVLVNLNTFARISICGQISQYNLEKPETGPRLIFRCLLTFQAKAEGFIVSRFASRFAQPRRAGPGAHYLL